jgi:hypothetical protein
MDTVKLNRLYLSVVLLTMLILPVISGGLMYHWKQERSDLHLSFGSTCRFLALTWLVFWGVGIRLVIAGFRQIFKPAFKAREIFHLPTTESHIVIRELGFANLTMGLMATATLFFPNWLLPAACMGIFFYGVAGIQHIIKKPASPNEWVALVSDCFISIVLFVCLI